MGKASKKKSQRRTGIGPSRTEIESAARQEQVKRRLTAALSEPGELADTLRAAAGQAGAGEADAERAVAPLWVTRDAVAELWGGATPVPAEIPKWEEGSLGDFFFTEPLIADVAAAPPAAQAVPPSPEHMLDYGDSRNAVASALIRTVVFDREPVTSPAVGVLVESLAPVIEWEAGYFGRRLSDGEADELVSAPASVIGWTLVEAGRAVIAEDRIAPVLEFVEPVLDAALAPLGLPDGLTGAVAARAVTCAVARAYIFTDPADTDLLNRLDPDSSTAENPLETLVVDKLLDPREAILAGLAVLAALAGLCRSNAASVLAGPGGSAGSAGS
jgi:hypothetical protein